MFRKFDEILKNMGEPYFQEITLQQHAIFKYQKNGKNWFLCGTICFIALTLNSTETIDSLVEIQVNYNKGMIA